MRRVPVRLRRLGGATHPPDPPLPRIRRPPCSPRGCHSTREIVASISKKKVQCSEVVRLLRHALSRGFERSRSHLL